MLWGEATIQRGLLLHTMLYFGEVSIRGGLLNKGAVYLRKYGKPALFVHPKCWNNMEWKV